MLRRFLLSLFFFPALTLAQMPTKQLTFAVVSVKPNNNPVPRWNTSFTPVGYYASDVTLKWVLDSNAYPGAKRPVSPELKWIETARFDIEAKVADENVSAFQSLTPAERQRMLQELLAERFHLRVHTESIPTQVYRLTIAKGGPKLKETPPEKQPHNSATGEPVALVLNSPHPSWEIEGATMESLARNLSSGGSEGAGRPVVDHTALTGRYHVSLHWTPEDTPIDSPLSGGPSLFTAIQEQLGLKLEPATEPMEFLVIDHAEQPTEN